MVKNLKKDRVALVLDNIFLNNSLSYDDLCCLRGCLQTGKTIFNEAELRWVLRNYRFWLRLIKGVKGRKNGRRIFLSFFHYSNNVYAVSRKLKLARSGVYRWVKLFEESLWLIQNPFNEYNTANENLLMLNHKMYPILIPLTKILIQQQIANETLS